VLLRVDVKPGLVSVVAFVAGVGEVGRAAAKLDTTAGIALAPFVAIRRPGEGFAPEFFIGSLAVAPVGGGRPLALARGVAAPQPAARAAVPPPTPAVVVAPKPAPTTLRLPPAAGPRRVVFVIDHSGSMQPRLPQARAAARQILAGLGPKDRVLVAAMDADTRLLAPGFVPLTATGRAQIDAQIEGVGPGAGTNYATMLQKTLALGPTTLVLLTDGEGPSQGPREAAELLRLKRDWNKTRATIHVVAVGRPGGTPLPDAAPDRQLAASTGGRVVVLAAP
jgi:hypothetical protein